MNTSNTELKISGHSVLLTNLNKIMYPEIGATKADIVNYYIRLSPYILPYLKNRPFSMIPFVNGAQGESFFQKQKPAGAPIWLKSVAIPSSSRTIDFCIINNLPSLVYMANRGCLEMHAWFSRYPSLTKPDVAVFDIDPSGNTGFKEAVAAAKLIRKVLDSLSLWSIAKTSGKSGIHVFVPIKPTPFENVSIFLKYVCGVVEQAQGGLFTLERSVKKRGNRVYLDAVQHGRGKTLPAPYSLRATPLGNVSTPVLWEELDNPKLNPENFTIKNIEARLKKLGDVFAPVYSLRQTLPIIH